ncbi:UTRA domain-containing protein [Sphingomonas soli]|uniref:UTRA domain-containing protein n=1 Tax=Sphingomonas soli TaxID=266127 RepID=UPI00082AD82E|nr:UTRA domain-containing protein [Sphingomonas soli]
MTVEERIRSDIEARVHSGEWRPGDRIPFEHELVASYGCSRATVSKALTRLARAGLIERRRKAGSFVADPQVHSAVLEVPDLAAMIAARGEAYCWKLLDRRVDGAELLVTGVHHAAGRPFCLETRTIFLAAVPEAGEESFDTVSPGSWLLGHVPWTRARHGIRAVEADAGQAALLEMAAGKACLLIERRTWRMDAPVTLVEQLFPGDRYDLVAEFRPGAS